MNKSKVKKKINKLKVRKNKLKKLRTNVDC